jgi:hypothetical protein
MYYIFKMSIEMPHLCSIFLVHNESTDLFVSLLVCLFVRAVVLMVNVIFISLFMVHGLRVRAHEKNLGYWLVILGVGGW